MRSFKVTPPDRWSRWRTLAVLLPGRGTGVARLRALAPLFALVALWRALVARVLVRGFGFWAVPVGCGVFGCSGIEVLMSRSPFAVVTAVTTWITLNGRTGKQIMQESF